MVLFQVPVAVFLASLQCESQLYKSICFHGSDDGQTFSDFPLSIGKTCKGGLQLFCLTYIKAYFFLLKNKEVVN